VRLRTPREEGLFSGIACFTLERLDPFEAVARLREKGIVSTVTPYADRYVRLTPSIVNNPAEIDLALAAVRGLA
jgi:isopenicillin-N epimerase